MFGCVRVVNAGSVGMPFGNPGADWLLLGPDVELRHTAYDFNAVAGLLSTFDKADVLAQLIIRGHDGAGVTDLSSTRS
jgi:hypothetical protein